MAAEHGVGPRGRSSERIPPRHTIRCDRARKRAAERDSMFVPEQIAQRAREHIAELRLDTDRHRQLQRERIPVRNRLSSLLRAAAHRLEMRSQAASPPRLG